MVPIYEDDTVTITTMLNGYHCTFSPVNDKMESYAIAKLTEVIVNNHPGAFPAKDEEDAKKYPGMRCFVIYVATGGSVMAKFVKLEKE